MEVKTVKKSERETTLVIENLGKESGAIDASKYKRQKRESQVQKIP
jgi:hypothetical protein